MKRFPSDSSRFSLRQWPMRGLCLFAMFSFVGFGGGRLLGEEILTKPFGTEMHEFMIHSKAGERKISGWIPSGWTDESNWGEVEIRYDKVESTPKADAVGLRAEVVSVKSGRLQIRAHTTSRDFLKGSKYVFSGWAKASGELDSFAVVLRKDDPSEAYRTTAQQRVDLKGEWQQFSVTLEPSEDTLAGSCQMYFPAKLGVVELADLKLVKP